MADFNSVKDSIFSGGSSMIWIVVLIIIVAGCCLLIVGGIFWYFWFKKRWNLKAEIKLPRANGKMTVAEWGKGMFSAKRGVCWIKRPGYGQKKIAMKIFDPKKYIQGTDIITVIQVGPEDYRPVLIDSFEKYEDDVSGEEACMMNLKIDTSENKPWKVAFDRASKSAYSIIGLLQQFQTPIAVGIVIIACFIGFAIMWTRLGSICG